VEALPLRLRAPPPLYRPHLFTPFKRGDVTPPNPPHPVAALEVKPKGWTPSPSPIAHLP